MKDTKVGNDAIETAAWVFMTADSVARGGEIKFQMFKEWDYDHFLKVTNTCWTELKTCNFYAMARVPDVSGASASISISPHTLCAAMVCTRMKIKLRTICPWLYSLPCILSKMPLLQRKLLQQSESICLHCSAKRARTNFLPGLCARALSLSCQCTVQSLFFRLVLGLVTVQGLL